MSSFPIPFCHPCYLFVIPAQAGIYFSQVDSVPHRLSKIPNFEGRQVSSFCGVGSPHPTPGRMSIRPHNDKFPYFVCCRCPHLPVLSRQFFYKNSNDFRLILPKMTNFFAVLLMLSLNYKHSVLFCPVRTFRHHIFPRDQNHHRFNSTVFGLFHLLS